MCLRVACLEDLIKREMVLSNSLGRVDQNLGKRFKGLLLGWFFFLKDGLKCQILLCIMRIYEI
jgi:hypothetical protein